VGFTTVSSMPVSRASPASERPLTDSKAGPVDDVITGNGNTRFAFYNAWLASPLPLTSTLDAAPAAAATATRPAMRPW